jgi:hypothetical protein
MRRPLNWIVVSISLMVLFANRMWAPRPVEYVPVATTASTASATAPASPFAYVREDGTQEYLPVPEHSFEAIHAEQGFDAELKGAVYTWSSPVIETEPQPQQF